MYMHITIFQQAFSHRLKITKIKLILTLMMQDLKTKSAVLGVLS